MWLVSFAPTCVSFGSFGKTSIASVQNRWGWLEILIYKFFKLSQCTCIAPHENVIALCADKFAVMIWVFFRWGDISRGCSVWDWDGQGHPDVGCRWRRSPCQDSGKMRKLRLGRNGRLQPQNTGGRPVLITSTLRCNQFQLCTFCRKLVMSVLSVLKFIHMVHAQIVQLKTLRFFDMKNAQELGSLSFRLHRFYLSNKNSS